MTMEPKDRAHVYRKHAEDLQRLARSFHDSSARRDLIALAESWLSMAERLETQVAFAAILPELGEPKRGD